MLSAYQADFGLVCVEGNSALHLSAAGGHAECCRFLAQRGEFQSISSVIKHTLALTVTNQLTCFTSRMQPEAEEHERFGSTSDCESTRPQGGAEGAAEVRASVYEAL